MVPEISIKKILYATDLSENARYAFAYAVSLAKHYDATITFLHVIPEEISMEAAIVGHIGQEKWNMIKEKRMKDAIETLTGKKREYLPMKDVLNAFAESACVGNEFKTEDILVVRGNPVEEIIKQSKEKNCDIIVMGTHGHGGLIDSVMGSTARSVLRRSSIPVLVVRLPN